MMKMDELIVRKDNKIVQKTLNKFSYKQNQLMAVLLGKYVNLNSNECINTTISVDELREVLGIKSEGGNAYERIRHAVERFGEHGSIGIYSENNGKPRWTWMPYFTKIELTENEVEFSWNENMKQYLIELKNNYTQYLANDYLKLKSIHSQNLYEQLKSLENYEKQYKKLPILTVDELRIVMQTNDKKAYSRWGAFKQLVLDKAISEITEVTDLKVSYKTIKRGRTVIAVEFDIKRKGFKATKNQKEGLPEWYAEVTQTEADEKLMAEALELQKKLKENK